MKKKKRAAHFVLWSIILECSVTRGHRVCTPFTKPNSETPTTIQKKLVRLLILLGFHVFLHPSYPIKKLRCLAILIITNSYPFTAHKCCVLILTARCGAFTRCHHQEQLPCQLFLWDTCEPASVGGMSPLPQFWCYEHCYDRPPTCACFFGALKKCVVLFLEFLFYFTGQFIHLWANVKWLHLLLLNSMSLYLLVQIAHVLQEYLGYSRSFM